MKPDACVHSNQCIICSFMYSIIHVLLGDFGIPPILVETPHPPTSAALTNQTFSVRNEKDKVRSGVSSKKQRSVSCGAPGSSPVGFGELGMERDFGCKCESGVCGRLKRERLSHMSECGLFLVQSSILLEPSTSESRNSDGLGAFGKIADPISR